jgi:hypothetical protein
MYGKVTEHNFGKGQTKKYHIKDWYHYDQWFRNLIPIDIMDRLPSATDTSVRADLSRIKFYRNIIVHCDSALVDDTDFEIVFSPVLS